MTSSELAYVQNVQRLAQQLQALLEKPITPRIGSQIGYPQVIPLLKELVSFLGWLQPQIMQAHYGPIDSQGTVSPATSPRMRRYSTSQLAVVPKLLTNNNNKRLGTLKTWFRYQYGTDPNDRLNNRALLNMLTNLKRNSEKNTQPGYGS